MYVDRTSHALVDKNGRVFGLLAAMPNDPTWQDTIRECIELLRAAREKLKFGNRQDRRGPFLTIAFGISYGGGQTVSPNTGERLSSANFTPATRQPASLCSQPAYYLGASAERLHEENGGVRSQYVVRPFLATMFSHSAGVFATHFPELYAEYAETIAALHEDNPDLRHIFEGGVWPAISLNFPPNSFCHDHTDAGNKANGLCPIFALGDYDPTKGGHLVLSDLDLVIEFPPGALIFIPSASLRHGNIRVREGESRASWTQYAAGGLFRWVRYGCRSWVWLKKHDSDRAKMEAASRAQNWEEALKKFPTMESLRKRSGV